MSSVLAHGTLTRQLPCSQHPSRCTRNKLFVQSNCRRTFRCRQYTCRRVRAGGAFGRLSAEDWRDFAPVGLVARKLLVNVSALFFLVLAESVPLCCADASVLPKASLQLLNATSVASHGALQLLHPFIVGVVPFVEAMIFIQMLGGTVGWDKLPVPPRFKLSRTEMQTPYGVAAIKFLSAVLGAVIAAGFATVGANILISTGAVGHGQRLDIIVSLVAGSAIVYKLSELITEFGLGQGISFIYMVSIASRMQNSWAAALQGLPGAAVALCLGVAASMTVLCVLLNGLKHYVPLTSSRYGDISATSSQAPPKLPIILCPHSTMVFIGAHFIGVFFKEVIGAHFIGVWFKEYQMVVDILVVMAIVLGNLADTLPTSAMLANSLKSMQLGIDGVSPGEDTQHVLAAKLVVVRIIGAAALITLYWASRLADAVLVLVAGVPLSVIEILIVVGTVTQCYKTVRDPSVVFLNFNGDSRGAETNTVQEVCRPAPRSPISCRWSDLCKKYKS